MTLYRKYRPQTFEEVIGQNHVVLTLQRAIESGRVGHAYLFCGPRGVGKTTIARILAKAVNCLGNPPTGGLPAGGPPCGKCANCIAIEKGNFSDLIEIDAASNRGIDEMRELRDKINYAPSVGKKKVYIIDEVHMLTKEAFNALLKTLEEPPAHSIFIFATTEAHKVPETVVSRCQKFDFRLGEDSLIQESVERVAKSEKLKIPQEISQMIVKSSGGSFRDAQSLLDQISSHLSHGKMSVADASKILHLSGSDQVLELLSYLKAGNAVEAIKFISQITNRGIDFDEYLSSLILQIRSDLISEIMAGSDGSWEARALRRLIEAAKDAKASPIDSLPLELAAIDICAIDKEFVAVDTLSPDNLAKKEPQKPNAKKIDIEEIPNVSERQKQLSSDKINISPKQKVEEEKSKARKFDFDQEKKAAIIDKVGRKNKPLSSLLGASQWHYDGKDLTISVEYALYREKVNGQKNRALIDESIKEIMGSLPPVKCQVARPEDLEEDINSVFAK